MGIPCVCIQRFFIVLDGMKSCIIKKGKQVYDLYTGVISLPWFSVRQRRKIFQYHMSQWAAQKFPTVAVNVTKQNLVFKKLLIWYKREVLTYEGKFQDSTP